MTWTMNLPANMYPTTNPHSIAGSVQELKVPRSNQELVNSCLNGDQTAWNELVDRYGRLVYYVAHRYGLRSPEADDVFQSVFLIVLRRLSSLKKSSSLSAWLITIAHREALRVSKAKARFTELDESSIDDWEPPLDEIHREFLAHQVREALQQLDPFSRDFLLAVMSDPPPTYEELAAQFNMAVGSIGPTRARCLKKLEIILKRMGVELD